MHGQLLIFRIIGALVYSSLLHIWIVLRSLQKTVTVFYPLLSYFELSAQKISLES